MLWAAIHLPRRALDAALRRCLEQVVHHLLLAIDGDRAATGQRRHVDAEQRTVERNLGAAMDQPLAIEPAAEAQPMHQVGRHLFQHAGTHPPLDIGPVAPFQHDRGNALRREQMGQEHAGRAGADNGYAGAHSHPLMIRAR
mgnify:CR=1 FL=1